MQLNLEELQRNRSVLEAVRGAYLVADLGNGGQERQLFNLVSKLSENSKILIIPWDFNEDDHYVQLLKDEPNIILVDLGVKGLYARLKLIRKVLNRSAAIYFHSYSFHLNFIAWATCLGKKRKAIGGVRNRVVLNRQLNGIPRFYLSLLFPYFRISNNYNCFYDLDAPTKGLSAVFTKTLFVHNGIDTESFKPILGEKDFKNRPLKSISVGRLFPVKQVGQIIDWVASMKADGIKVQHEHAGKGPDLESLEEKVKGLGLENEFTFKGNVNDVPGFMNTAQVFVHAARFEGCPNVIMEAMACGLPVLASNAGDTSFIIDHGENGYVFEIDDCETMLTLGKEMASKPDLLATFADNGQIKAKDNFGISQYVKAVREAYSKMKISI